MAMLNQNEKELLKVVRYFNTQRTQTAKLVKKLMESFDVEDVAIMTGFDEGEVYAWQAMAPERKKKTLTEKVEDLKKRPAYQEMKKAAEEVAVTESKTERVLPALISINGESSIAERLAHEMSVIITDELKSGDKFYSRKEAMTKFECGGSTVTEAFGILFSKGWIEFAEPGNFRKGYVVK